MTKPIPDMYHTITPHLVVQGAAEAIAFYVKAFGAEEIARMPMPDGRLMHAEIRIGDSIIMLADDFGWGSSKSPAALGANTGGLLIYSDDVDAAFQRALDAGATVEMPLADMFWGDRYGRLKDPFGHGWAIATHIEDVAPEEMAARALVAMKDMG